jgi:hypothetical protein
MTRLGSLVVLADHAAEYLPLPDWQVQRGGGLGFLVGPPLMAGLVRPVPVVMVGVLAEDRWQVPFVVDEHPVGAGDAGRSDGEPIVHSACLAGFAGHDCDTQS